jgi:hypothetical protein
LHRGIAQTVSNPSECIEMFVDTRASPKTRIGVFVSFSLHQYKEVDSTTKVHWYGASAPFIVARNLESAP